MAIAYVDLDNFKLLLTFPAVKSVMKLPSEVKKLLGHSGQFVGAYPPVK